MPLSVLIIDDNRLIAASLAQMIESLGHKVQAAFGSMAGMQALGRQVPDVILLDIHMQGLNGVEFCRLLRRDPKMERTIILVISTDNQPSMIQSVREAGADGFLAKPIDMDLLESTLKQVETSARR